MTRKILTIKEVADCLNITPRKVLRLVHGKEKLPVFKDWGTDYRCYRVDESELLRWMDAHKIRRQ